MECCLSLSPGQGHGNSDNITQCFRDLEVSQVGTLHFFFLEEFDAAELDAGKPLLELMGSSMWRANLDQTRADSSNAVRTRPAIGVRLFGQTLYCVMVSPLPCSGVMICSKYPLIIPGRRYHLLG